MRLAQNITQTGGFGISNFEVNGQRREGPSFESAGGHTLGDGDITATFSNPGGNWYVGTLDLHATKALVSRPSASAATHGGSMTCASDSRTRSGPRGGLERAAYCGGGT
jgi:hypothetical protein